MDPRKLLPGKGVLQACLHSAKKKIEKSSCFLFPPSNWPEGEVGLMSPKCRLLRGKGRGAGVKGRRGGEGRRRRKAWRQKK